MVGDVERLALDDASFDKVSSTCGIMFSPDHEAADWVEFFETTYRVDGEIRHTREYLLVLGRRR